MSHLVHHSPTSHAAALRAALIAALLAVAIAAGLVALIGRGDDLGPSAVPTTAQSLERHAANLRATAPTSSLAGTTGTAYAARPDEGATAPVTAAAYTARPDEGVTPPVTAATAARPDEGHVVRLPRVGIVRLDATSPRPDEGLAPVR